VPYTAVIPIIVLALKWVVVKLVHLGLLPKAVGDALHVSQVEQSSQSGETIEAKGPSTVKTLKSQDEFENLLKDAKQKVVCKFTASWCKPCHRIQPVYEALSSHYEDAKFLTVDVDDYDGIASKYSVSMMPTFVVVKGDQVLGKYSGSNDGELHRFLKEQVGRSE